MAKIIKKVTRELVRANNNDYRTSGDYCYKDVTKYHCENCNEVVTRFDVFCKSCGIKFSNTKKLGH